MPIRSARVAEDSALAYFEGAALLIQLENPRLSFAQAYLKAIEADPAAYAEYVDARDTLKTAGLRGLPRRGRRRV
jgi:hypothetical protein